MMVTGYKFQHTLRELAHQRDMAAKQFSESLFAFEGEDKVTPRELMDIYVECEQKIARIQTAQQQYNLAVTVDVAGKSMRLSQAIKMVGGAGRAEKMWRSCAADTGHSRYGDRETTRDATQERARRQVTVLDAMALARGAAKHASALRAAVQIGNAIELSIVIDSSLFE